MALVTGHPITPAEADNKCADHDEDDCATDTDVQNVF